MSCFKASINSRVSLANSVEGMVNIISSDLANGKEFEMHEESDPNVVSISQQ